MIRPSNPLKNLQELYQFAPSIEVIFYFLIFTFFREEFVYSTTAHFSSPQIGGAWTHAWIPVGFNYGLFMNLLSHVQIVVMPFLLFFVRLFWVRFTIFLMVTVLVTTKLNYNDAHNLYLYFYTSFILLLFTNNNFGVALRFRCVQIQILIVYFISGVWKLLAQLENIYNGQFLNMTHYLSSAILEEYVNSNRIEDLGKFIVQYPMLGAFGLPMILLTECLALPVIFYPKLYPIWGLLLVGFHTFARMSMGIYFREASLVVACFLILPTAIQMYQLRSGQPS